MSRPRDRKGLSAEDLALWRHVTRDDARLAGRDYLTPPEAPTNAAPQPPPPRDLPPGARPLPEVTPGRAGGVDKRTAQRLKRGQLRPEGRIDLHGRTQSEAHADLAHFLADAQAAGKRCVLVITGKGVRRDGSIGVLRQMVPRWLNEPGNRRRIIAVHEAQPRDGGGGALYVLLRKGR